MKRPSGMEARIATARRKNPGITEAEARAIARASYRAKNKKAKARQLAALTPGNPKHKRAKAKGDSPAPGPLDKKSTKAEDLAKLDILEFAERLGVQLHPAQAIVLKCIYGLALDAGELDLYRELTGGAKDGLSAQHGVGREATEAVLVLGGRSGKSFLTSIVALYECLCRGHIWRESIPREGELIYVMIVATKQSQAEAIIGANCLGLLRQGGLYDAWVKRETASEIELVNDLCIMSLPCNSKAGRGFPIFLLILDEVAHYFVEGPKADSEVYDSLSPRQSQFKDAGAKTFLISTPAAKQGLLWEWFREGFEVPGRVTFQAPTVTMNPAVNREFIAKMAKRNPDNHAREFDAKFAERRSAYLSLAIVESAMKLAGDVKPAGKDYVLGVDQSGFAGRDRFAVAVAHAEQSNNRRRIVVDVVKSWASDNSDIVFEELLALRKLYHIREAVIDNYAKGWVTVAFEKLTMKVEVRPPLPQIYANGKGLMIAGDLDLPDHAELKEGLLATVAYYGRNNSLSIEHPRTDQDGHGDLADAVMTATWKASAEKEQGQIWGLNLRDLGVAYPGEKARAITHHEFERQRQAEADRWRADRERAQRLIREMNER